MPLIPLHPRPSDLAHKKESKKKTLKNREHAKFVKKRFHLIVLAPPPQYI